MMHYFSQLPTLEALEARQFLSGVSLSHELVSGAPAITTPILGAADLDGQIQAPGEKTLYAFTASASGHVTLDLSGPDGQLAPRIEVFNSRGQRVAYKSVAASHDSKITMHVSAGQKFFVRTSGGQNSMGLYTLTVNSMPTDDFGNSLASATLWKLGRTGSGIVGGRINYSGDVDVIGIIATKTGKLKLDMTAYGRGNNLACQLVYLDANGKTISADYDSGDKTGATITIDVVAGREYFIQAVSHNNILGQYTITASTQVVAPTPTPPPSTPADNPSGPTNTLPTELPPPTPGSVTTAQVVQTSSGMVLLITGTNGADTITISQGPNGLSVVTPAGTQTFTDALSTIIIYSFDGADTITVQHSVTLSVSIDTGAGNDTVYALGAGASSINCGDGDDMIVTVGGGASTITGGSGFDSFWIDSADTVTGVTAAETAANAVHTITQFYQPYSTSSANAQYIPLDIAGQNFTDPTSTGYANVYKNFSSKPLFVGLPSYSDIRQGFVGDCYLMASLASVATVDPQVISQMVTSLGDGTYAVRFFRSGKPVYVRVDGDLPTYYGIPAYAGFGAQGQIWAPIIEKAYAYFRYGSNSYASLDGGWMTTVYQEMTNLTAGSMDITGSGASAAAYIATSLANGHAVTVGSKSTASGPVIAGHAYMVKSVETTSAGTFVTVYNPWGYDGMAYDSNSNDGLLRLPLSTFAANYTTAIACAA